jgi:hypothetical protein
MSAFSHRLSTLSLADCRRFGLAEVIVNKSHTLCVSWTKRNKVENTIIFLCSVCLFFEVLLILSPSQHDNIVWLFYNEMNRKKNHYVPYQAAIETFVVLRSRDPNINDFLKNLVFLSFVFEKNFGAYQFFFWFLLPANTHTHTFFMVCLVFVSLFSFSL